MWHESTSWWNEPRCSKVTIRMMVEEDLVHSCGLWCFCLCSLLSLHWISPTRRFRWNGKCGQPSVAGFLCRLARLDGTLSHDLQSIYLVWTLKRVVATTPWWQLQTSLELLLSHLFTGSFLRNSDEERGSFAEDESFRSGGISLWHGFLSWCERAIKPL